MRPGIADKFWTSIYPTIATGGKCIITSTPSSDEDKFAKIWFNAKMAASSDPWVDVYAARQKDAGSIDEVEDDEEWNILYENDEARLDFESKEDEDLFEGEEELEARRSKGKGSSTVDGFLSG